MAVHRMRHSSSQHKVLCYRLVAVVFRRSRSGRLQRDGRGRKLDGGRRQVAKLSACAAPDSRKLLLLRCDTDRSSQATE